MKTFLIALITFFALGFFAQHNPVKFDIQPSKDTLVIHTTIEKGWHLYAAHLPHPNEGPLPTEFVFEPSDSYEITAPVIEPEGHTVMDDAFGIEVKYFETSVVFKQPIKIKTAEKTAIKGMIYYMVCNDEMCIPFDVPVLISVN